MKARLRSLFEELVAGLDPRVATERAVAGLEWGPEPVWILAVGKAAGPMAAAAVRGLERVAGGLVVAPGPVSVPGLEARTGGHPHPDHHSFAAAEEALRRLQECGPQEQVLFLLSGGGSALLELPLDPAVPREEMVELHRLLVGCGAGILAVNAVRKHLSAVKGGRLARAAAAAARQTTLFVSDVPPGHDHAVASGPTMPDPTTVEEATGVLEAFDLMDRLPPGLGCAVRTGLPETPGEGDPAFARARSVRLMDNATALAALRRRGEALGWRVVEDLSVDDRPVQEAAEHLLGRVRALRDADPGAPVCVLSGGELSCPVTGQGIGGRNLHFALECARRIAGERLAVLSAGTDGIDGNSPAAGAAVDGDTAAALAAAGRDPVADLAACDAWSSLRAAGEVIETGPTGTNVRDVRVLVAW